MRALSAHHSAGEGLNHRLWSVLMESVEAWRACVLRARVAHCAARRKDRLRVRRRRRLLRLCCDGRAKGHRDGQRSECEQFPHVDLSLLMTIFATDDDDEG